MSSRSVLGKRRRGIRSKTGDTRGLKRPRMDGRFGVGRTRRQRAANLRTGGFLGIEKKFYDTAINEIAIASGTTWAGGENDPATVNTISAPAQGDGESNRDGRKIVVTDVYVSGTVLHVKEADQTAADTPPETLVALVLDTQSNGAQLNAEDVYSNPSANANLAAHPLRNLQYSSRFKVLATALVIPEPPPMTYDGTNIEQAGQRTGFVFKKKLNMPVTFNSTTAGISNVVDNSLHIIALSSDARQKLSYNARIRFMG